jgi:hypothetical protein
MNTEHTGKDGKCGIVMPISEFDGCSESHWSEVLEIIERSIQDAGFDPNLVSNADEMGVIQKRIVQNLYDNPIVVCDISGRNPNVMFELGMRLAFDKPTIVIKDDKTPFSFDTSPIEHLTYPRDLRFSKIESFQEKLVEKIQNTAGGSGKESFLKSFGSFKVAQIDVEESSVDTLMLDDIQQTKIQISEIRSLLKVLTAKVDQENLGSMRRGSITSTPPREEAIGWDDERVDLLKTMWANGRSASEIGSALGASRNSVIGKIHRLGLTTRTQNKDK